MLVVDNEEADREMLAQLLVPLGFVLRTAASGHDALDLLAAGYRPDVIFMDLAMPGIDGWETIRRLRRLPATATVQVAVVSANAFDKGLENDVGITAADFITKPVRHSELLDWLEQRLQLQWTGTPPGTSPSASSPPDAAALVPPPPEQIAELREAAALGYYRGVLQQLDRIQGQRPECSPWVDRARALARSYDFGAILALLDAPQEKT